MASQIARQIISTVKAPLAASILSQAVRVDHTLYISGQVGVNPETSQIVEGGVVAEAHQVLKNIGSVLEAAGSSYDKVVKATVLLKDINDFAAVNEVYASYFPTVKPARMAYQVVALPRGANVEIEAVAVVGDLEDV
uniref:2-iminobutanoate/2-iminopropanoate deaminase n=1 Tax=Arion vulgaris TaxID=1028688 RepID=A0A0B7A8M4_9EUPU